MTSKFDQAVKWAQRKSKDELPFNPNVKPVVLSYQFQDSNDVETKDFLKLIKNTFSLFIKIDWS